MNRLVPVAALCAAFFCGHAFAQEADDATRAAARTLGYAGVESYQVGDFEAASAKLEKAYQVLQVPSLGLWSARALEKRGLWVEAAERYRQIARLPLGAGEAAVQQKAQIDARDELSALEPKLPKVIIELEGAEVDQVTLRVDGKPVATALIGVELPMNPGAHRIEGVRGEEVVVSELTLEAAHRETVTLRFREIAETAVPAAAPSPEPSAAVAQDEALSADGTFVTDTLPWILIGTGVAAAAAGTVTYVIADGHNTEIDEKCPDRECGEEHTQLVSEFNTLKIVYPALWISGGVLTAAGSAILVFRPGKESEVSLHVSPGALWASGRF
jgi:hypothetical protein